MNKPPQAKAVTNEREKAVLSLVALKLKDQVLFAEKTENAKKYLRRVKLTEQ